MARAKETSGSSIRTSFSKGFLGGAIALIFDFVLRLGGLAPFPPESALEAFLRIIPESIQEPSVQALGDFAGELGLIIASIIALLVYGIFGILFERIYAPRMTPLKKLSRLEKFLLFSLVPWAFFGLVILPLSGTAVFGVFSTFTNSFTTFLFPTTFLLTQILFGYTLSKQYPDAMLNVKFSNELSVAPAQANQIPKQVSRRAFIEKGIIAIGSLVLIATSADKLLQALSFQTSSNIRHGTAIDLQDAPSIFMDPRLQSLVNSEVTSNETFYRVAIDIFDPSVDMSTWALKITGLVNNPKSFTIQDIQNLPSVEQYTTFECVSNVINGNLISNAKWTGTKISDVLNAAGGILNNAKYVVFYSVDGYSVGIPISKAVMADSILAYKMNDVTLPQAHGFPLRTVIPGLYGMMSAKFINHVAIVDSVYEGYWQTRGWSNDGTVHTLAFISVPDDGAVVSLSKYNGSIIVGGVAFAGDRGISKVEISVDGGQTWQEAQLKKPISNLTWALWAYAWHPKSTGNLNIYARATDGTVALQLAQPSDTFPNGATGYSVISMTVTD